MAFVPKVFTIMPGTLSVLQGRLELPSSVLGTRALSGQQPDSELVSPEGNLSTGGAPEPSTKARREVSQGT